VELVACGDNSGNPDWNLHLIETLRHDMGLLDHLSLHRYWGAGHAVDFTEEEFYLAMRGGELIEADIRHANALLQGIGGRKKVGIAFDEWGLWHPQANGKSLYEAPSTQRDAVAAAHALDVFQRNADTISMANIAQIVNVLQALIQTSEDKMWLTPTYHTFALYAPHRGATSLPVDLSEVATRKTAATQRHWPESSFGAGEVALVSASASRQADVVHVSVSNRHYTEEMTVQIALRGASAGQASAQVLTADAPNAHNTHDNPARAKVGYLAATVENRVVTVTLPASSVATVSVVVSGA
jgi:alpha-N-arabinofuranosidase